MKNSRIETLLTWLERRFSSPLDEATWRRRRNRVAGWFLALAALLAIQTAMVHSPRYILGAIYHERRVLNIGIQAMAPAERAKLLERLCLAAALFDEGGADPYKIDNRQCDKTPSSPSPDPR